MTSIEAGRHTRTSQTIRYKAGRRMMTELNATQLPEELHDVQTTMQMSDIYSLFHMLPKKSAPRTFYLQELLSDRPIIVIQFEYAGRDRTSPGEAGSGRPSQPVVNQRFEAGQPLFCIHGRSDNMLCRNLPDVLQKSKLHLL